jgi:hypothetical protein
VAGQAEALSDSPGGLELVEIIADGEGGKQQEEQRGQEPAWVWNEHSLGHNFTRSR